MRRTGNYSMFGPPHRPTTAEHRKRIGSTQISSPIQNEIIQRSNRWGATLPRKLALCEAGPRDGEARSRGAGFRFTTRRVPWASKLFVPRKPKPEDRQYPQQSVCESYEWGLNTSDYDRSGVPGGSGAAENGAADHGGPVHLPDRDIAAAVLPQNVGTAVTIVVAGADRVPARPRVGDAAAADHAGAVQLPDRDFAAVVLPQDVRAAVAVEIAGANRMPARPRI